MGELGRGTSLMARGAGAFTGLLPDQRIVRGFGGGLNTSMPPDGLGESESPDLLNLMFTRKILSVTSGVSPYGGLVVGQPQRAIRWEDSNENAFELLLTTRTLYKWSAVINDWIIVPSIAAGNPTLTGGAFAGAGGPTYTATFAGVATWITGQLVGILMDNGRYLIGTTGGTVSPLVLTIEAPSSFPTGRIIANGATVFPLPTFTSTGLLPTSYAIDPVQNWLMFVNSFNPPQRFNGVDCIRLPDTLAAGIDTASYITRFHNVTVMARTVEGGTARRYRVRRSAVGNSGNWTTLGAGFDDLSDNGDDIHGMFEINPFLIFVRDRSIIRAAYYGVGDQVFYYDKGLSNVGAIGKQGWTQTRKDSLIISEAGVFRYLGDNTLTDVGDNIFNYLLNTTGDLNPSRLDTAFVIYLPTIDETWLFYPSGAALWPNKVLRYNHQSGGWFPRLFGAGLSFLGWGEVTEGLALPWSSLTGTWQQIGSPWNARSTQPGFATILLCGATDNQVYKYDFSLTRTDNGAVIPWYFTSKDFVIPSGWETLDSVTFYGSGIIDLVEISTDHGATFQTMGTNVNMGPSWGRASIDRQYTTNFVRLRLSGTDPSFKLSWFALATMSASE